MANTPQFNPPDRPSIGNVVRALERRLPRFFLTWAIGTAISIITVMAVFWRGHRPTEAYEGFGQAALSVYFIGVGICISFVVAIVVALLGQPRSK